MQHVRTRQGGDRTAIVFFLGFLGMVAALGAGPARAGLPESEPAAPVLKRAHSHNDYEQPRPLEDALSHRFASVEADVWLVGGDVLVSHDPFRFRGSLRQLYLDPLQRRVDQLGSVYGDGRPFYLWIDLKQGTRELRRALHTLLSRYPMLSVFTDRTVIDRPVTVILTGDEWSKDAFMREYAERRATRDSTRRSSMDPPGSLTWSWYALNWRTYFNWRGFGPMPPRERERLAELVRQVHAGGRRLRFFGAPDLGAGWQALHSAGVDLIGTDDPAGLGEFLRARHSLR